MRLAHRPNRLRRAIAAALSALALAGAPPHALATFEALDVLAHVRLPGGGGTGVVATGPFSVFAWVHPGVVGGVERSVLRVSGALELGVDAQGRALARLRRASGSPGTVEVASPGTLAAGKWSLIAASFDPASGALWVAGASDGGELTVGETVAAGFTPGPASGDTYLGAAGGVQGLAGATGLVTIRREAAAPSDAQAVWVSRRFHAPYDLVTTGSGGLLTGEGNAWWMVGHSLSTLPTDGLSVASSQGERAGLIGGPVTSRNFAVYDRGSGVFPTNFTIVRPVSGVDSCVYVSHHEGPRAGFFVRRLPTANGDFSQPRVEAAAPRARRLVTGPVGTWKVMVSGNSRSAKRFDGSGWSPGNYAHGFAWLDGQPTSGVMNVPLSTSKTPWFGFDSGTNAPYTSGTVLTIGQFDVSRFWTGSVTNGGVGPGNGVLLTPGAQFGLRCKPEGLIRADAPLLIRAHALAAPGASELRWAPNKFTRQGAQGVDEGPERSLILDTTVESRAFNPAEGDAYDAAGALTLTGDWTGAAPVGRAVTHGSSISVVSSVDFDVTAPGATTIRLEHPFVAAPGPGAVLRFGPWRFETIEFLWPALAAGDANVWRGLRLRAVNAGQGSVVFGMDGWRPDVDGFVWGVSGWGGNGYQPQIDTSFSGAIAGWVRLFSPDVWLQTFAQQYTQPAAMSSWAELVRGAAPHADVVWLGDMAHTSLFTPWHTYILENGAAMGIPAVSLLMHPRLGDQNELFADGMRADGNHISQRGNERLAELWLEALEKCALGPALPGDANGDGLINFADLNLVLSEFNLTGQGLAGDVNFDNRVDFADLNLTLDGFGLGG